MKMFCKATLVSLMFLAMVGCDTQSTIATLVNTLGMAVSTLESIEGNAALSAQIQKDTQAASSAVLNWKTGTASQDVIAALNLVEDDLYLLPVSGSQVALIDLAIGTTEAIISEVSGSSSTAQTVAPRARTNRRTVYPVKVKDAKDFKSRWNTLVAVDPKLAPAAIK